jgi:hypothetical protein
VTGKAYAALLEGTFANYILDSDSFEIEYYRLKHSTSLDATAKAVDEKNYSLQSLKKLGDRMEENRIKFPWKTPFSVMEDSDSTDFV